MNDELHEPSSGTASEVEALTERIRRLTESEQRLRLALEGSGMVGIWTLDVQSRTTIADANVARTYGLSPEACEAGISDSHFMAAIHPEDLQRVSDALNKAIETRAVYRCRYRVVADGAHLRWVITSARPVCDETGAVSRLLGVVIDVTDQMETASALAESRFQFQTLTETLPQIVWSCDAEGRHDYFSARWSEFTGVQPQDITEDTWKTLVYSDHWPMVSEAWDYARRTGVPYDIDYRFRHRSGEYRWLRVMALPMRDEHGRITRWFGTSTDVHETYLLGEERERLARELERVATEDYLTRALTRRAFFERSAALQGGEPGPAKPASLLMLDIDHFKAINDTYGHPVGDKVLATVADLIKEAVRSQDIVGRLGGEEFAVFLPQCSKREALAVAERIRSLIETNVIHIDSHVQVQATVSIGSATSPHKRNSVEDLLKSADSALYQAKAEGRNRTVLARRYL
ncbi:diguanylate cyclase [Methylopila henanensis]|uniref:Diguanylate cyclase n=1 Tax=Methylopila henanensis TaxID=873516 RepID=A0ABW4KAF5_9HYPH